jgi:hypothetical protein
MSGTYSVIERFARPATGVLILLPRVVPSIETVNAGAPLAWRLLHNAAVSDLTELELNDL